jgi:hypothetical protein
MYKNKNIITLSILSLLAIVFTSSFAKDEDMGLFEHIGFAATSTDTYVSYLKNFFLLAVSFTGAGGVGYGIIQLLNSMNRGIIEANLALIDQNKALLKSSKASVGFFGKSQDSTISELNEAINASLSKIDKATASILSDEKIWEYLPMAAVIIVVSSLIIGGILAFRHVAVSGLTAIYKEMKEVSDAIKTAEKYESLKEAKAKAKTELEAKVESLKTSAPANAGTTPDPALATAQEALTKAQEALKNAKSATPSGNHAQLEQDLTDAQAEVTRLTPKPPVAESEEYKAAQTAVTEFETKSDESKELKEFEKTDEFKLLNGRTLKELKAKKDELEKKRKTIAKGKGKK